MRYPTAGARPTQLYSATLVLSIAHGRRKSQFPTSSPNGLDLDSCVLDFQIGLLLTFWMLATTMRSVLLVGLGTQWSKTKKNQMTNSSCWTSEVVEPVFQTESIFDWIRQIVDAISINGEITFSLAHSSQLFLANQVSSKCFLWPLQLTNWHIFWFQMWRNWYDCHIYCCALPSM